MSMIPKVNASFGEETVEFMESRSMSERKLWTVATGEVDPFKKASRDAVKFISTLHGFVGVHPLDGYTIWLFDTENNAKIARNKMQGKGIVCGTNICDVYVDEKYLKEQDHE